MQARTLNTSPVVCLFNGKRKLGPVLVSRLSHSRIFHSASVYLSYSSKTPLKQKLYGRRLKTSVYKLLAVSEASVAFKKEDIFSERSALSNGELPKNIILGEKLGNGTFGTVYLATDTNTGDKFAIKVVSKQRHGRDQTDLVTQNIEHEVAIWCELQNSYNAVKLIKFFEDDENFYLVQELCSGGSLEDLIKEKGCLSEIESGQAIAGVLTLLSYCHDRNICYCDVKPANFMIPFKDSSGYLYVKAVDFGSCERIVGKGIRGERGTPLYMAPEVQSSTYGLKSDIWSVGILLYHLLSGKLPFVGSVCGNDMKQLTPTALSFAVAYATLTFDGEEWNSVSEDAKDLISKMLERDVSKRITAQDALQHPFVERSRTISQTTFSAICPMEEVLQKNPKDL